MSGGYSLWHKKDPGFRESKLMKKYAVKMGVPAKDVLIEDKSRDTNGNAQFTKQIVRSKKWRNIIVVTSDFHIFKTKYIFDFIYGDGYNIVYRSAKTSFKKKELEEIMKRERKSVDGMKALCKKENIKRGDDSKVGKLLKEFYERF
jgi:uncharacterized SAM-binding protein YcdF (DUF218 family)